MVSVRHPLLYVLYSNIIVITVVNVMKPSECSHVELSNSWASNLEAQLEQLSPAFKGKGACQRLSAPTHLFLFYCGAGAREGGGATFSSWARQQLPATLPAEGAARRTRKKSFRVRKRFLGVGPLAAAVEPAL